MMFMKAPDEGAFSRGENSHGEKKMANTAGRSMRRGAVDFQSLVSFWPQRTRKATEKLSAFSCVLEPRPATMGTIFVRKQTS
jgi:hypothetical protein